MRGPSVHIVLSDKSMKLALPGIKSLCQYSSTSLDYPHDMQSSLDNPISSFSPINIHSILSISWGFWHTSLVMSLLSLKILQWFPLIPRIKLYESHRKQKPHWIFEAERVWVHRFRGLDINLSRHYARFPGMVHKSIQQNLPTKDTAVSATNKNIDRRLPCRLLTSKYIVVPSQFCS